MDLFKSPRDSLIIEICLMLIKFLKLAREIISNTISIVMLLFETRNIAIEIPEL